MVKKSSYEESEKRIKELEKEPPEDKRAKEEEQRCVQLDLVHEVTNRINSELALKALFSEIVTSIYDTFDYYGVMLLLVDEETNRLTMQSILDGYADIFPKDLWLAKGEGMIGYAAATGETQLSGDVTKHPHFVRKAEEETKSELSVPIKSGQNVIGVLDLYSDQFNAFDKTDVSVIETLAGQIAVAIKNARLYETVQQELIERRQAEEALRESEERYRTVADFTYDWEFWIGPDGHYIYVSPSCEWITGYSPEEFINDPGLFEKIIHADDHLAVVSHIHQEQTREEVFSIDFRIITRSGEERWISHKCQPVYDTDGNYLGRRASNRDISKRKKMQEELLKVKKLESLGVLAGGIAHDFNNLLASVVGNISLAIMEMKPGSKTFETLVKAEKIAIQTKDLTARLITFSKGGGPIKETVSIGNLVKDPIGSSLSIPDINYEFSIPDNISPVEVDENQMKNVIHNIVINAAEAMSGQGTIKVYCENVDIGEKDGLALKHGKYVKISIKDQGPGIPEENLTKIFDPYFSTKSIGSDKGQGLGLAVCHSIVKKHDGLITVESESGIGITFVIYLPTPEKEIKELKLDGVQVQSTIINRQSSIQRVLVMDDEDMVREVTDAMLSNFGYEVEVAVEGSEAIEMYKKTKESGQTYDLVILDLTNKIGMGGKEAIKKILEIDPDVKGIVSTGYSYDPIVTRFREYGFCGALTKPFSMDELSKTVREVLDAGRSEM